MDFELVAIPVYHQQHLSKAARPLGGLGDALVRLGQLQLLRKASEFHLAFLASYDSKLLHSAIKNLNSSVVAEQKASGESGGVATNAFLLFVFWSKNLHVIAWRANQ